MTAVLTLGIVVAGCLYLRGWRRRRSIPSWRAWSFLLGLLAAWAAAVSPIAAWDAHMLTAHMTQLLLLMTVAPPLIWLGQPLTAARPRRWVFPERLGSLIRHPVFCWLAAALTLIVWHVPAIFQLAMESPVLHFIEHASFFTAGLLFWRPVIQPRPHWPMLLYLFLATLPCDVLSGLLVFSDRVAYPMYLCVPPNGGLSPLEDQQCAAALMWTCVTVVFLVAGTILSIEMLSPKPELREPASA